MSFPCVSSVHVDPYVAAPFLKAFTPIIQGLGMVGIEVMGDLNLKDENTSVRIALWSKQPPPCQNFIAASFSLRPLPSCCGVLVSHQSYVTESWRGRGVGSVMQDMKTWLGRTLRIGKMIATVVEGNATEEHILRKYGWVSGAPFVNHRTGHTVVEWEKVFK
jgi:hypothetical protein